MTAIKCHIPIALPANMADGRLRLSGALRFLSAQTDADVRVFDVSAHDFETECRRLAADWNIDGIIFTFPENIRTLESFAARRHRPVLAMLDGPRGFTRALIDVRMDTRRVTDSVADLFRRRGFGNFAFCGTDNPADYQYSRELEAYFGASVGKADGLSVFHEDTNLSYSENLNRGAVWVSGLPKPCGIFCYSDALARNVLNACRYAHVNVPEQVAIIGTDNAPEICEMTKPTLSSILPDFEQSGYLAAEALYRALKHPRKKTLRKTYGLNRIIERASTQDLRGGGRFVRAATELIRTTTPNELSAEFVARKLNISRRLLEIHFKNIVGHGIHAEISRQRLNRIHDQLIQTNLPISEIVVSCGYRTLSSAQIAFHKRYGKSMRSTRMAHLV